MTSYKTDVRKFLESLPLFCDVTAEELDYIVDTATEINLKKGATVFKQGDSCEGFYLVIYGQVKLSLCSPDEDGNTIEIIRSGQSFGETAMLIGWPYNTNAQAIIATTLLYVPRHGIFNGLEKNPKFSLRMLEAISQRIYELSFNIEIALLRSARQRVIKYLLKTETLYDGMHVTFTIKKGLVASLLNLTPEHFSRILQELVMHKLIVVRARKVIILSVEKLRIYKG